MISSSSLDQEDMKCFPYMTISKFSPYTHSIDLNLIYNFKGLNEIIIPSVLIVVLQNML